MLSIHLQNTASSPPNTAYYLIHILSKQSTNNVIANIMSNNKTPKDNNKHKLSFDFTSFSQLDHDEEVTLPSQSLHALKQISLAQLVCCMMGVYAWLG